MRTCVAQMIAATKISIIICEVAVTGFEEVETKPAAITGDIVRDLQPLALIAENPIHLVLQIVSWIFASVTCSR